MMQGRLVALCGFAGFLLASPMLARAERVELKPFPKQVVTVVHENGKPITRRAQGFQVVSSTLTGEDQPQVNDVAFISYDMTPAEFVTIVFSNPRYKTDSEGKTGKLYIWRLSTRKSFIWNVTSGATIGSTNVVFTNDPSDKLAAALPVPIPRASQALSAPALAHAAAPAPAVEDAAKQAAPLPSFPEWGVLNSLAGKFFVEYAAFTMPGDSDAGLDAYIYSYRWEIPGLAMSRVTRNPLGQVISYLLFTKSEDGTFSSENLSTNLQSSLSVSSTTFKVGENPEVFYKDNALSYEGRKFDGTHGKLFASEVSKSDADESVAVYQRQLAINAKRRKDDEKIARDFARSSAFAGAMDNLSGVISGRGPTGYSGGNQRFDPFDRNNPANAALQQKLAEVQARARPGPALPVSSGASGTTGTNRLDQRAQNSQASASVGTSTPSTAPAGLQSVQPWFWICSGSDVGGLDGSNDPMIHYITPVLTKTREIDHYALGDRFAAHVARSYRKPIYGSKQCRGAEKRSDAEKDLADFSAGAARGNSKVVVVNWSD